MIKETKVSAKTVDLAVEKGAAELDRPVEKVLYEVLEQPKKGILGIGSCDALVRVYYEETPADIAYGFISSMLENMDVKADIALCNEDEESVTVMINGDDLGLLIGKHGDVLDAIQHLTTLAANKGRKKNDFYRVSVDVEGYREKRAESLRMLARRMAEKVLRSHRSFSLEPMNPYERRIIHSEVQEIEGVTTYSVGQDADRRIVIAPEKKH